MFMKNLEIKCISMWLIFFEDPPCLSLTCLMLLKFHAKTHFASRRPVWAKWFHSMALGSVWLNPYTLMIPILSCVLSCNVTYTLNPSSSKCRHEPGGSVRVQLKWQSVVRYSQGPFSTQRSNIFYLDFGFWHRYTHIQISSVFAAQVGCPSHVPFAMRPLLEWW